MRCFKVTGRVAAIHAGIVRLDAGQAAARGHNLRPVVGRKGCWEVAAPIEFKRGECFWYDGEVSKTLALELDTLAEQDDRGKGK